MSITNLFGIFIFIGLLQNSFAQNKQEIENPEDSTKDFFMPHKDLNPHNYDSLFEQMNTDKQQAQELSPAEELEFLEQKIQ